MHMPHTMTRSLLSLTMVAVLSGCSTLPRDGPSARAISRGATSAQDVGSYQMFDLDYASTELMKSQPPRFMGSLVDAGTSSVGGMIGPGDILSISIFEPSGSLFGAGGNSSGVARSGNQSLPPITVDRNGFIAIPFAGQIQVSSMTTADAASAVRPNSQFPE